MKNISKLIEDVYKVLETKDGWFSTELSATFSNVVAGKVNRRFLAEGNGRAPTLRLSQMGPKCPRALWYSLHQPEVAEKLPPWAEFKFCYGDIIEELALVLARAAGHSVEGEQDAVYVDGITGHRDCVVDGCVVDVKSCSSRVFEKIKTGMLAQSDDFGYLEQLDGYIVGSYADPLVRTKDRGYIWAIDKTLGKMVLYEHFVREQHIRERIRKSKEVSARSSPPICECKTVEEGKSGNFKLDTKASYSAYKFACHPNLRTFLYAKGPVYLTHVERKPDVPEINRDGRIVYH